MRYLRYHIPTEPAPNATSHPNRFRVQINRLELIKLLIRELIQYRGNLRIVLSRPCIYGVFGGPLGGFVAREQLCVGCLRCTVQHPEVVQIHPNPQRLELGDSYFDPDQVDTVLYEAATGRVPVRGAGYGGGFGGDGWDAMWTDMSEIVRPTRDGIHGRETISTAIELGSKPKMLEFDPGGRLIDRTNGTMRLPIPVLFDHLPIPNASVQESLIRAAAVLQTLAIQPLSAIESMRDPSESIVPLLEVGQVDRYLAMGRRFSLVELASWDSAAHSSLKASHPDSIVAVRVELGDEVLELVRSGVEAVHLLADYHGRSKAGFSLQAIRNVHEQLVSEGIREQVSLIGSGGIVAAEHMPKAIIAGLDGVVLDTVLLIALQGRFRGELRKLDPAQIELAAFDVSWGSQRLINLIGSWRDQLLEILGAMGLREVRRLRGEIGRAMFQAEMEAEAFGNILGFEVELHG